MWKRTHQQVAAAIAEAVTEQTGLSSADTAVLVQLGAAEEPLRQAQLCTLLGWDRTRLSHQVTRMSERGLVRRDKDAGATLVSLTPAGEDTLEEIRPLHAAAVRRYLIAPLGDLGAARAMLAALADVGSS